ncbi:MAG: Crp/Fnr family transcriptional regulator [Verrucomicrobiales bacterium]|nr:Crp/Fnr family transcriptional regulator [Verrucomicrobiales bacterium]
MEALQSVIAAHPFSEGMSTEHVALLAAEARQVRFAAGHRIAEEGAEATHFYLILRGRVAVEAQMEKEDRLDVQAVEGGQALGWSWLFPPFRWHFTARAVEPVEALEWDTSRLRETGVSHPTFGFEMARRITSLLIRRLRATHERLVDCSGAPDAS